MVKNYSPQMQWYRCRILIVEWTNTYFNHLSRVHFYNSLLCPVPSREYHDIISK